MSSTICANEDGYAGSGRAEEAPLSDTLDAVDCAAGSCDDSVATFGGWDSSVAREANHDLKAVKSTAGVSFFFLRKHPGH